MGRGRPRSSCASPGSSAARRRDPLGGRAARRRAGSRDRGAWHCRGARGAEALRRDDRRGEPRARRLRAARAGPTDGAARARLHHLPRSERTPAAARPRPLGRSAADGGDRARAHGGPDAPDPRRAVARPRAADRRVHLRRPARDQPERRVDPPRGAERPGGADPLAPGVPPRGRPRGGRGELRPPPPGSPPAPRPPRPLCPVPPFLQPLVLGLLLGGLYGLAAAGLSLVFGVLKVLNVAHGQLIMLGGYGAFWLFALRGLDPFASLAVVIPAALVAGVILYWALFGWVVRAPEETRVKNSLLVGFGLALALDAAAVRLFTADERSITTGYAGAVLSVGGL